MFEQMFRDHPRSVGETYCEHLRAAAYFGVTMVFAGLACLIHAIVPGLFVNIGSTAVERLHDKMILNRRRVRTVAAPEAEQDRADNNP